MASRLFTLTRSGFCCIHPHDTSMGKYASAGVLAARPASCCRISPEVVVGRTMARVFRTRSAYCCCAASSRGTSTSQIMTFSTAVCRYMLMEVMKGISVA